MTRLIILCILLLVAGISETVAQALNWQATNKYWGYRKRFLDQFIVIGESDPSCSEPSGYSIPAKLTFALQSNIRWADATAQLGWYMSVLATEYGLENLSGNGSQQTLKELYFAMKAYERLDRRAERLYYPQNPNADCSDAYLNGLFVRDDVGANSFLSRPEFRNLYLDEDGNFSVTSDYTNTTNGVVKDNVYPSQDQITDLLMGFALVKKYLGNATYQGFEFRNKAMFYAGKIIGRLNQTEWVGRLENGEMYENGNTFLTENTAVGLARAGRSITGTDFTQSPELLANQVAGWNSYGIPSIGLPRLTAYYELEHKDFSTALIQAMAAVGSSWEYGLAATQRTVNIPVPGICFDPFARACIRNVRVTVYYYQNVHSFAEIPLVVSPVPLPDLTINVTSEMLSLYGATFNQQIFSLLHENLYGEASLIENSVYVNMINSAPCEGPHHMPMNDQSRLGVDGWRATNRFNRPLASDGTNDIEKDPELKLMHGEFNGMDYMLLHNLFLLNRSAPVTFKNRVNQESSQTLTASGNHWSYETLDFNGQVQANSSTSANYVEISAGKSVTLKPGFHTQSGAKVRVYTATYDACNTAEWRSSNLRTSEPEIAEQPADPMAVAAKVTASVSDKVQSSVNAALEKSGVTNSYVPLATYLDKRAHEAQVQTVREQRNDITIFPNPTTEKIHVSIQLIHNQNVKLQLCDINGRVIRNLFEGPASNGVNEFTFDVTSLPEGTFLIQMYGQSLIQSQKFVKTPR